MILITVNCASHTVAHSVSLMPEITCAVNCFLAFRENNVFFFNRLATKQLIQEETHL